MKINNLKKHETNSDILLDLVNYLNLKNMDYAIVSATEEYPSILTDVDFIVDNKYKFISCVTKFCSRNSLLLVNAYSHTTGIRCEIVKLMKTNKSVLHFPGPDILIYSTWKLKRDPGFSFKGALRRRVFDKRGFYTLSIDDFFLFYFIKRVDKGDIGEAQFRYLQSGWGLISQELKYKIQAKWGEKIYETLVYSLSQKTNEQLVKNIWFFNRQIRKQEVAREI